MKTKAKLFSLLLVLALLAVGLVIGIAAADEGEATIPEGYVAYTDEVNGITALKATLSGAKWLIYPTEADFIADKEDNGFIDGTGATAKTNNFVLSSGGLVSNGGKYVYLLEDATHTGAATINFYNNTFKLDLGGNKLSVTLNKNGNTLTYLQIAGYKEQDLYNASYCDFTICNGEVLYPSSRCSVHSSRRYIY